MTREEALKTAYIKRKDTAKEEREFLNAVIKALEQEPKTGHWIIYTDCEGKTRRCVCDRCGYKTGEYTWKNPKFCADCGAKMVEKEDKKNDTE